MYNRQHYDNVKKTARSEGISAALHSFVDINGLKLINDAFGYDEGDKMIQTTAALLKVGARRNETIARIGGDEFAILMPKRIQISAPRACRQSMRHFHLIIPLSKTALW